MLAARNGHERVVERLLMDPRVDPNLLDEKGKSALMIACQHKHWEIVRILLACNRTKPTAGWEQPTRPVRVTSVTCSPPYTLPPGTNGRVPSAPMVPGSQRSVRSMPAGGGG